MAAFESLGTVSYLRSITTMAVSLAVSTQYTNVTVIQPDIQLRTTAIAAHAASLGCSLVAKTTSWVA